MRSVTTALLGVGAVLAHATSAATTPSPHFLRHATEQLDDPNVDTNVCDLDFHYCNRDPDCGGYVFSVHDVSVRAIDHADPVTAMDLATGDKMVADFVGKYDASRLPTLNEKMTYRMYNLDGHNMAATGVLGTIMTLDGQGGFVASVPFQNEERNFDRTDGQYEFTLDIFIEPQGTHEGTCVTVSNVKRCSDMAKDVADFVMECTDNGDGTFTPVDPFVPLTCTPIQAPACKPPPPPPQCDIEWWYCPRDPDCDGYDMSVEQIVVSTDIGSRTPEFFAPGDSVNVHVNGTTTLTSVDPGATYRIYQLAGGNQATGVLADVIQINGDRFDINLPFGLVDGNFVTNLNWFEFGIDIFREPEGTKESFCAEVGNVPYREYLQSKPPAFDQYCVDDGGGHFHKETVPAVIHKAICVLHPQLEFLKGMQW